MFIEREEGVRGRISRAWVTGWSMRRIGRGGELEAETNPHVQYQQNEAMENGVLGTHRKHLESKLQ